MAAALAQATALLCLHQHRRVYGLQTVAGKLSVRDVLYNKAMRDLLVVVDCSQQQLEALPVPDPQSLLRLHTEGAVGGVIITCAGSPPAPAPLPPNCFLLGTLSLRMGASLQDLLPVPAHFCNGAHVACHYGHCLRQAGCSSGDGQAHDFYSRFFAPWVGLQEDSVTGSAHSVLAAYWASKIPGKLEFKARQCSPRGGELKVKVLEEASKVQLLGQAVVMFSGSLRLSVAPTS